MENKYTEKSAVLSAAIVVGLFLLGLFIYKGLKTFSDKDRVVTVKGLAEMSIKATAATITFNFSFSGDDLPAIIKQTEDRKTAIIAYLKENGYTEKDVAIDHPDVTDLQRYYEDRWTDNKFVKVKVDRYTIAQKLTVPAKSVENTEKQIAQLKLDLISKNLTAIITSYYAFPELNSIKPQLIAESTKNARVAGEQFANDSQATLGKIKTASQGQITIAGKYFANEEEISDKPQEPYLQKARVVSTIVFFLE